MRRQVISRSIGFIVGLAAGALIAAVLLAIGAPETWPLVAGWVVFFSVGGALVRLQQRREHSH